MYSTIGHDTQLGDFVTCSPGVNISGNCKIGNRVLIGTNSAIKENITIYNVNISKWYSLFPLKYYNKFYGKCCLVPNQNGGLL